MRCRIGTLLVALVASVPCSGCGRQAAAPPALSSSKQFKVIGIAPTHFANGGDALVMNCETDIPIDQKAELRKQVDEIRERFRIDVENAKVTTGVIRMVHNEGSGIVTHGEGYGFAFEKRADGKWHCLEDDKK